MIKKPGSGKGVGGMRGFSVKRLHAPQMNATPILHLPAATPPTSLIPSALIPAQPKSNDKAQNMSRTPNKKSIPVRSARIVIPNTQIPTFTEIQPLSMDVNHTITAPSPAP